MDSALESALHGWVTKKAMIDESAGITTHASWYLVQCVCTALQSPTFIILKYMETPVPCLTYLNSKNFLNTPSTLSTSAILYFMTCLVERPIKWPDAKFIHKFCVSSCVGVLGRTFVRYWCCPLLPQLWEQLLLLLATQCSTYTTHTKILWVLATAASLIFDVAVRSMQNILSNKIMPFSVISFEVAQDIELTCDAARLKPSILLKLPWPVGGGPVHSQSCKATITLWFFRHISYYVT